MGAALPRITLICCLEVQAGHYCCADSGERGVAGCLGGEVAQGLDFGEGEAQGGRVERRDDAHLGPRDTCVEVRAAYCRRRKDIVGLIVRQKSVQPLRYDNR